MKKAVLIAIFILMSTAAQAHFMVIVPSTDMAEGPEERDIKLHAMFTHPMEGSPKMFWQVERSGFWLNGKVHPLRWKFAGKDAYATLRLKRPGVYQIFIVPKPYFEPAEDKFIKQIVKVYVEAFGLEEGWVLPVGLEAEIVPYTRPFGIWEGNTFVGWAVINGRPCAHCAVEVEYLNTKGVKVPKAPLTTQVVVTDERGFFAYTIPWAGWWGFSVLGNGGTMERNGKRYPVELDAVLWIKAYPKPEGVR